MVDLTKSSNLRIVKAVPDPLGLYIRVGHNDHRTMSDMLANGNSSFFGAIFDPTKMKRQSELKDQILDNKLDAILDTRAMRSSTIGGYTDKLGELPWGSKRPHIIEDFQGVNGRRLANNISSFTCDKGFTQVMAPTHYFTDVNDTWFKTDIESACRLRDGLNRGKGSNIPIIYPLAISYATFRNQEKRREIIAQLQGVPMDSLWLMIDGMGRNSTATAVKNYLRASSDFQKLGVPIVADHIGGMIGLSLLAFGAVGGLAHGVGANERFSTTHWRKPPQKSSFGSQKQIYLPSIDSMLSEKEAEELLNSRRAKSFFACTNTSCCPRGVKDMFDQPSKHFLYQRMSEVAGLSNIPESLRPQRFLEQHLRPATDRALAAAKIDWKDDKSKKKMENNRKHLDALRISLGEQAKNKLPTTFAKHPAMRLSRSGS